MANKNAVIAYVNDIILHNEPLFLACFTLPLCSPICCVASLKSIHGKGKRLEDELNFSSLKLISVRSRFKDIVNRFVLERFGNCKEFGSKLIDLLISIRNRKLEQLDLLLFN